jgi:hypothetical protein
MEVFYSAVSVTLAQLPGVLLRYIPFSKLVTKKQKSKLLVCYSICFILQTIILFTLAGNSKINPLSYKIVIMIGATTYFFMNIIIIKKMFFQHAFILGMQGVYSLSLHSFVAIILHQYTQNIAPTNQLMIQSFSYLLLFILTAYPLWQLVKNSFILNISSEHNYYWNIIWLIPILLYFSNVIITMNGNWINTWQQFISRLLTGTATFVIWKCVNLDFKELDEKLALSQTNKLLNIQMEAITQQAKNIHENDEKLRILRHDMRHNVQMLSSLIQTGELSSASLLLAQLNDNLENTRPIVFCKNPVINSSLLVYISRAQKEGIEIISEIDISIKKMQVKFMSVEQKFN